MSQFPSNFNNEVLLDILNQSKTATAIHSTDEMIIEMANDAMIALWGKDRSVIGKPIEEALPELKGQPFLGMLQKVLHTGITVAGSDTMAELEIEGKLQPFYFDFEYKAIKDKDGEIICVLHTALDVTDRYLSRRREIGLEAELQATNEELAAANEELGASNEELASTNEELIATNEELSVSQATLLELNNELAESEKRFRSIVTQAPVAIGVLRGRNLVVETANKSMLAIWGKNADIFGTELAIALPELQGQAFLQILDDVYTSGVAYNGNEAKASLERDGQLFNGYYNFIYHPINDIKGSITGILVVANEVTDQVLARHKVQASQLRLNNMVMTAPIGMVVLRGRDLVIEIANQPIYDMWQRNEEVLNKRLLDVFPELIAQPFPDMLQKVFDTGERFAMSELVRDFAVTDGNKRFIVDFAYDPLFDLDGNVEAILATVVDVTDSVNARDELQKARDILKQAIDSAAIGTWSADMQTDSLIMSDQAKKIHGIPNNVNPSFAQSLELVVPEYVEKVKEAIEYAINTKDSFDVEYMINPMDKSKQRWLRSTGKAYFDEKDKPLSISGTIIDITENKYHDQRKDDFISIASHELKTPVTSLKAALQLLDKMKGNPSPGMLARLIEQSNRSMDKISTLIDDLLNVRRMNEGHLDFNKTNFLIADLLNDCCNHVRVAGKNELILQGDEQLKAYGDEHRIDQVVVNLVNNAVKYAPNSREIYFNIEKDGDMAKISVKDTGPGIEPEKQAHLFERYYRADASGYQNSGLGLGLYISAEIVKRHGGEIGVNSESGKGSTFWFTVPLAK